MDRLSRIVVALCVGCGQVGQTPGNPPPPVASAPVAAPASDEPVPPPSGTPDDRDAEAAGPATMLASPGGRPPDPSGKARPVRAPAAPSEAQVLVDAHNRVRARHCAGPLTWSSKLAEVAQRWANSLRDKGCRFGHSGGTTGENLAAGTAGTLDPEAVVKMWYDEVAEYKFPDGGFSMRTGHFTQVVWRGTTQVGCGRSQCKGMDIWVCEYDPAGNWEGQYRENVRPRGCR